MKNLAKTYRLAGIKGMCESNGTIPVKKKVDYKSQFVIVERLENESFQDWKERCKINK